ncbi:glycoside hydrolase domain-containing protein [Puniceicoccus vermicola]|uniref:Glycoside hydrolase 123-like N-terminal domain-containing protein n=1 Tax=Puniceicoccus vermicola TaxID=388746 RepID=A0A7X1E5D9_9BACT|nr:glycoside hydrolase domain-containing protein [Puniceicoccus vermicola]MBC2602928.1 hypothetical protein [Puniceicoccus vermicola]
MDTRCKYRSLFLSSLAFGALWMQPIHAENGTSNHFTIPMVEKGPEIDGQMSAGEWNKAVALSGFIDQFDNVASARQVTYYVQADSEFLYLAQKSEIRPEETVAWDQKNDTVLTQPTWFLVNDSAMSFSVAAGEVVNADEPSIFQYSLNATGRLWKNEWAPLWGGTIKARGGEQNFRYKNEFVSEQSFDEDKTIWISEVSLPLSSFGVKELKEGDEWKMLLARDYPNGDQTAWTYSPDWQFSDRWSNKRFANAIGFGNAYTDEEGYAETTFSATEPVVRVLGWGDLANGVIDPNITIYNPGNEAATVMLSLKHAIEYGAGLPLPNQEMEVDVPAGSEVQVDFNPMEAPVDLASTLTFTATGSSGAKLMYQAIPLKPSLPIAGKAAPADLSVASGLRKHAKHGRKEITAYDPINNHLNLELMGNERMQDQAVHDVILSVRKAGEVAPFVEEDPIVIDESMRIGRDSDENPRWLFTQIIELPELEPGLYEVTATSRAKDGSELAEGRQRFIRYDHEKELPWLDNQIGVSDRVLEPWTPIEASENGDSLSLDVTERIIEVGGSGLWRGVQVNGEELLVGPVRVDLTRDGSLLALEPEAKLRDVEIADHEVSWRGGSSGSGWNVEVQGRLEYDGYNEFRIKFNPPADNGKVDSIRLVVPLKASTAKLLHATGGIWMRSQVSSIALAEEEGQLWNSGQSRSNSHNGTHLEVGNFKPYVWVGNVDSGVAFMADSDQGWVPPQGVHNTNEGSIEVERDGETVNLVLNLVARPFTFTKPREVLFSLQPTPIKPFEADWRERRSRLHIQLAFAPSSKDGWSYDGQKWRGKNGAEFGGGHGNQHFPLNWELNREREEILSAGFGRGRLHSEGTPFLPYQILNGAVNLQVEDEKVPGLQGAGFMGYLGAQVLSTEEAGSGSITKQDMDHRLFRYQRWAREVPISGFYFDNSFPGMNSNPWAGQGYFLDLPDRPNKDGKIQAGYNLVNMREFFKRLRTVFEDEGRRPYIWLHATDSQMVSAYAFADVLFLGENFPRLNDKNPWFSSKFDPATMQVMASQQATGFPVNILEMWGKFDDKSLGKQAKRDLIGWELVHDTDGSGVFPADWRGMDISRPAEFLPYWDESVAESLWADQEEIYVSAWRQENDLRVIVFNRSDEDATDIRVALDLEALEVETPEGGWVLADVENSELELNGQFQGENFSISLDVPAHDYRLFTLKSIASTEADRQRAEERAAAEKARRTALKEAKKAQKAAERAAAANDASDSE